MTSVAIYPILRQCFLQALSGKLQINSGLSMTGFLSKSQLLENRVKDVKLPMVSLTQVRRNVPFQSGGSTREPSKQQVVLLGLNPFNFTTDPGNSG